MLHRGATAVAICLSTALSGCTGLPPLGDKPQYGRVDIPDPGPPEYRRWLPAEWDSDTDEVWFLTYVEPGSFHGPVPEDLVSSRATQRRDLEYLGIGYENYDSLTRTTLATVREGTFSADTVRSALAETGYESDGSYRDYDLYARSDIPRRVAVRDGVVVSTSASLHSTPDLEATIDAGHGDTERYHEVDTTFEAVTDAVGASRLVSIGDHPTLNPTVAELGVVAFRVDYEAAYPFVLERYPETVDQPGEQMKDAIQDQHFTGMAAADTIDIRVDGQLATAGARIPLQPDEPRDLIHDPPQITWGVAFDAESETATLRHELGPELDADRLWYDLVPIDAINRVENRSLWPGRDTVGPGDETTVDMSDHPDADRVDVRWGPKDHPYGLRLFSYVPDRGE
ncbi:hypothetical protein GCM10009006_33710 [Haloarcula argentinensis]|uniref:Uncharacterized protein n=2 Tax=Haloarcula argentinensis TaxID=43776 RepID=A0A830FH73_HALAR|nr:hypothetical protein GCM10009006_33710 [Haloarcula argentinensis]